jgi:hypothetical protein
MITEPTAMLEELRNALSGAKHRAWSEIFFDLDNSLPSGTASRATVETLRELLSDARFLALDESWKVADLLLMHWEWLSTEQRETLRETLVQSFDRFRSYMGAFVVAEIFGEFFGDDRALDALDRLSSTAKAFRSLVPHGLEYAARYSPSADVQRRAVAKLTELTRDPDEQMRDEATNSLHLVRLARS